MEDVTDPHAYEALLREPQTWRAAGYESATSAALDRGALGVKLLDWGHSELSESKSRAALLAALQDSGGGDGGAASLALERLPPAKGLVEVVYTFFLQGRV